MSRRTTFRLGGRAAFLLEPRTEAELGAALSWAGGRGLPVFAMGRGSNLVVSDSGWDGAVVRLADSFSGTDWDGGRVRVRSGTRLTEFVMQAVGRGLAGCEKLAGIPGTAGGAVSLNAGAYGQEFSDQIVSVRSMGADGAVVERARAECSFGYRDSIFRRCGDIVLSADLQLDPGAEDSLREAVREAQRSRADKQPLDLPNAGSLFKRPPGGFAAKMIEEAGLKGFRVGNAAISSKHAGFAVNLGGATASEVWTLSCEVIRRVRESCGVELEREVVFLGRF